MSPSTKKSSTKADLIVVANRLPVRRVKKGSRQAWETSPGGLVAALMPILKRETDRGRQGAWVGWSGARAGKKYKPFHHEDVYNLPLTISREHLEGYYDGMANQTLWPLYHDVVRKPVFRRKWYRAYEEVNQHFADNVARIAAKGATVWVHDYHLHLVPGMLREQRPDLRIGFFLHIPLPGRGLFAQLPWRTQIIKGTTGADVVGFQTRAAARNFVDLARWYADAESERGGVNLDGRHVEIDAFPISIDSKKIDEIARRPETIERARTFRDRVNGRTIMLGVDRMDYTKGIDIRLRAFQELLREGRAKAEDVVLVQSGVPTREGVGDYADLRSSVEELVGQINGEFGEVGRVAVQYLRQNLPMEELVALYFASDIMLVTPYRDGMNLIAKEYVASHHDIRGRLVLSEFTGASFELSKALLVNPHDLDGLVNTMEQAIEMPEQEAEKRMRSMRRTVFKRDVYAWADGFMDRLSGQ
jgi:trehalose 6-phosphate synthase